MKVRINGETDVRRSPLVVPGLILITLGIYGLYRHWRVNKDASLVLRDPGIRAGVALLAVTLGWLAIVPPFVSIYRTGERIERMERETGVHDAISPVLFLLLHVLVGAGSDRFPTPPA
ncbi:MAG: DUF4234 domain-containing protein [Actinomycetota bacterium]